jgi:hypothetical protein
MIEVPTFMFYVATAGLIVLSFLGAIFLVLGILIALNVHKVSKRAREESFRIKTTLRPVHELIGAMTSTMRGFLRFTRKMRDYK